ncbi:MAG: TIGR02099 family protein, partial [Pseudomonadota bacterium]|nr:TIGR02099 family protein [Pseudomonadota bacterium]
MPTLMHRRLRLARRSVGYVVAVALIAMALVLGAASQILPLAERHPERIAAWLSARAGRPVAFDQVQTRWTRRGPLLKLGNLRVGAAGEVFAIGDAEMLVSVYGGLLPGHAFSELRLRNIDLTLERDAEGRWQVRGLPGQQQAAADPFAALEGLGELQVIGGRLSVVAPSLGIDAQIPKVDLRLRVSADKVRAGLRAWPVSGAAAPLDAAIELDRSGGNGRAYAGADRAELAAWSPLLRLAGVGVVAGRGRAYAWARVRDFRVDQITVQGDLQDVVLGSLVAPLDMRNGAEIRQVSLGHVEALAQWRLVPEGWRLDAPKLRVGQDAEEQTLDGLLIAGGERVAVMARRVDARALFQVAALTDRLAPGLRRWLHEAGPAASLSDVEVVGAAGALRARANVEALTLRAVGGAPGVSGLAGKLSADADGFSFHFADAGATAIVWPQALAATEELQVRGRVTGWREGDGWRVGSPGLRVAGDGIGLRARGSVWWQADGSRPRVDLAAQLDDMPLARARTFLPRHRMPPRALHWLDTALQGGTLENGRVLLSGDLDQWPFRAQEGHFQADAQVRGGVVRFHPDWPAVDALDARLELFADGLHVEGRGALAGVPIESLSADIDQYRNGRLLVQARGGDQADGLLALLRVSPLQKTQSATLNSLSVTGAATATLQMLLPLRPGGASTIKGQVELRDARLDESRWDLAFDRVNGRIDYSRGGFSAEGLEVRHLARPGTLSLRAGPGHVLQPKHAFEAQLDATLEASRLLERAPAISWLDKHLEGASAWRIGLTLPRAGATRVAPGALVLTSDLVGTALDLPEPLRKPAARALATVVRLSLPLDSGDVRVDLGNVMGLRVRSAAGRTGIRAVLGGARVPEPPETGVVATGAADRLDALGWLAVVRGTAGPSS